MQPEENARVEFVRKMTKQSMDYARDLLDENGRLIDLVSSVNEQTEVLVRHLSAMAELLKENDDLRQRSSAVEVERARLGRIVETFHSEMEAREQQLAALQRRINALNEENKGFVEQFAVLEQQNTALANLYVAAHRLNGTAQLTEVVTALQEIIANLVGSEEMAIFEMNRGGSTLSLVGWLGVSPEPYRTIPVGRGIIGRAALHGERYVADGPPSGDRLAAEKDLTACIPLKLDGEVIGIIAIFRLLPQKKGLQPIDLELFDLLSSQAATSLFCTTVRRTSGAFSTERPTMNRNRPAQR